MKTLYTIGAIICATSSLACDLKVIEISDAYARSATPNAQAAAAFMVINNTGEHDVKLIGGKTSFAKIAEVHTHTMDDKGVMSMKKVEGGLTIPAGQCVFLERGGDHVMLMGLEKPMTDGGEMDLALEFEGAHEALDVKVAIDSKLPEDYAPKLPEGRTSCLSASMPMGHMKHSN